MSDRLRFAVLFSAVALAGCGGPPPVTDVSGSVNLNGKPLAIGTVTLIPAPPGKPVTGPVVDGRFTVTGVTVGPNKVSFLASKPVEKRDNSLDVMGGGPASVS
ncbi:MAG: hypothetical protein ACRC7O_09725, partial [Fimbriiglobus sp.]